MTSDSTGERPVSLRVVRGTASASEIAALVVALGALAPGEDAASATAAVPAWTAAARLEGVGARLVGSRADLTAP